MKKEYLILLLLFLMLLSGCSQRHKHSFHNVIVEATCKEEGSSVDVCNCGEEKNKKIIPILNHQYIDGECINCHDKLYKEIYVDDTLFTYQEKHKHLNRQSNFLNIIQDDKKEYQSVPILEFSKIEDEYIGVYVDKAYMDLIRQEAIEENISNNILEKISKQYYQKEHLSYQILSAYYNIISREYSDDYYTLEGKLINKENVGIKYYQINKNASIPINIGNYEIIGLYGSRKVKIVEDLYINQNIGKEYLVYFGIPVTIVDNRIIVEEDYKPLMHGSETREDTYNSYFRLKSNNNKYLYSGNRPIEEMFACPACYSENISIITTVNNIEYIVTPEWGIKQKNEDPNGENIIVEISMLLNKDLSEKSTSELVLQYHAINTEYEEYVKEYIKNNGYIYEVYNYREIVKLIDKYTNKN